MNETRRTEGEFVSDSNAHLSDWTLEQLAEGMLSEYEHQSAVAHIEACPRCTAELNAYRSLFSALAELPRFAPSPEFGDGVISRIRIGPAPSPVLERVRRWLPATRRGWAWVAAAIIVPALPLIALVVWIFSQPMVSALSLVQWGSRWSSEAANTALNTLVRWETAIGLGQVASSLYAAAAALPIGVLLAATVVVALGIPLSAWSLIRLIRTPMGDVHYAN
jgi:anti-sigma factor RsiW